MQQISRESLQQRYADLSDAALRQRLGSADLTDLAREVGLQELAARGLSLTEPAAAVPAPDTPPAQPQDFEFAQDRFTQNPYQTPRGAVAAERPAPPVLRIIWWIYVAYLVCIIALGTAQWVVNGQAVAAGVAILLSVWAVAGLVAWRLRKPLLGSWLWVICLALSLAQFAVVVRATLELTQVYTPTTLQVALTLGAWLLSLPLLWGLFSYAFLSAAIWHRNKS